MSGFFNLQNPLGPHLLNEAMRMPRGAVMKRAPNLRLCGSPYSFAPDPPLAVPCSAEPRSVPSRRWAESPPRAPRGRASGARGSRSRTWDARALLTVAVKNLFFD